MDSDASEDYASIHWYFYLYRGFVIKFIHILHVLLSLNLFINRCEINNFSFSFIEFVLLFFFFTNYQICNINIKFYIIFLGDSGGGECLVKIFYFKIYIYT